MIILIDTQKTFDKKIHFWFLKNTQQTRIKGNFLNLIKGFLKEPIAKTELNGETLNTIFRRSGTKQECPLFPLLFNIVLEILAMAEAKRNKRHKDQKERKTVFTQNTIVFTENPAITELISDINKVAGYQVNI